MFLYTTLQTKAVTSYIGILRTIRVSDMYPTLTLAQQTLIVSSHNFIIDILHMLSDIGALSAGTKQSMGRQSISALRGLLQQKRLQKGRNFVNITPAGKMNESIKSLIREFLNTQAQLKTFDDLLSEFMANLSKRFEKINETLNKIEKEKINFIFAFNDYLKNTLDSEFENEQENKKDNFVNQQMTLKDETGGDEVETTDVIEKDSDIIDPQLEQEEIFKESKTYQKILSELLKYTK